MKESAIEFLQLAAAGRTREAFDRFVGPGFRHHNPYFKGDATSLRDAMQENAQQVQDRSFAVQRALQDGDVVAVHSHVRLGAKGIAVVHILRFEAGKIVEFWDVGQEVPENSPNENGMF